MTDDKPNDYCIHSLARAVARGQTVAAWARRNQCTIEDAREMSDRAEFPELVGIYRRQDAEDFLRELSSSAVKAVHELSAIVQEKGNPSCSFEAAKALIEKWVEACMQLEHIKKLESLEERVRILEERPALDVGDILRNSRN